MTRTFVCNCGQTHILPNIVRCPSCHMDLMNHTDTYSFAHICRCTVSINPKVKYSDNPRGRPPKRRIEEHLSSFVKTCHNCGKPHCAGNEEGTCDEWEEQTIKRCPCCGRCPTYVGVEGSHALICDECNLKMIDPDRLALISRWNKL